MMAVKSKVKVLADSVSGEGLLPGWMTDFLPCPQVVEKARKLSGVSFIRALIPFMRASSS